jgi:hypothetical protein
LDTRTILFPGAPDRTCDTVAELSEPEFDRLWALVVEFQTKPDEEMFGRLLEYLGRFWREKRPTSSGKRYFVAAAIINLTGRGQTSLEMSFRHQARTLLHVLECNMADQEAASLLETIAAGTQARTLLPWVPLMRGGIEQGIIARWKVLAAQEPLLRRQDEYPGLAAVFSDLVSGGQKWRQALEGWNVTQSPTVLEWQRVARIDTKVNDLLELLEVRFGKKVPQQVVERIKAVTDLATLDEWFRAAITIGSMKEFRQLLAP